MTDSTERKSIYSRAQYELTAEELQALIKSVKFSSPQDQLTVCVLSLHNGETITGEYSSDAEAGFDESTCQAAARYIAERRLLDKETAMRMSMASLTYLSDELKSIIAERIPHDQKALKLEAFMNSEPFGGLSPDQQAVVTARLNEVRAASQELSERLQAMTVPGGEA